MGIYHDYDSTLDVEYWYVATGGRDGRIEYKSLNRSDCIEWVELRALGASLD